MAYGTALGATEAVSFLLGITIERIAQHNRDISARLIDGLAALGATVLGPSDPKDRSSTVAARFPATNSADFAHVLKEANVVASLRRDFIRFSPHLYNNADDIDRALEAIGAAL